MYWIYFQWGEISIFIIFTSFAFNFSCCLSFSFNFPNFLISCHPPTFSILRHVSQMMFRLLTILKTFLTSQILVRMPLEHRTNFHKFSFFALFTSSWCSLFRSPTAKSYHNFFITQFFMTFIRWLILRLVQIFIPFSM